MNEAKTISVVHKNIPFFNSAIQNMKKFHGEYKSLIKITTYDVVMCISERKILEAGYILYAMPTQTPLNTANFAHPRRNVAALGVEPGMSVADFGSGSGIYVLHMAEALEHSGRVYAIDVQQDLLKRVKNEAHRRGFKNVDVIWTDLERAGSSKFASQTLDLVLISNLLFQIENKAAVLAEAWRILKPKGRLAIIDWSESFGGLGPQKGDVVSKEVALALARNNGFELQREFSAGAHHYGMIFRLVPPPVGLVPQTKL